MKWGFIPSRLAMDLLRGVGKGMGSLGKGVVSGAGSLVGVKNKASKDIAIPTIETNDYFEASQFFPHIVSNLQMLPQLSGGRCRAVCGGGVCA